VVANNVVVTQPGDAIINPDSMLNNLNKKNNHT
jgi:hypothetical protein